MKIIAQTIQTYDGSVADNYQVRYLRGTKTLVVGLLDACVPAAVMTYFILNETTPFNIKHVSNFY